MTFDTEREIYGVRRSKSKTKRIEEKEEKEEQMRSISGVNDPSRHKAKSGAASICKKALRSLAERVS
jgi:hypothetical protein